MGVKAISVTELHRLMRESSDEFALIDVREQGVHSEGHPLLAVSLPLSHLELRAPLLLPRKSVAVYLLDQGPDLPLAERAAEVLQALGYDNLHLVEKGIVGWHEAGLELFTGINVPGKAFGEFVAESCNTPTITAKELSLRQARGERMLLLDCRPFADFHRLSIPGAINVPGAELLYRLHECLKDETTPVIVHSSCRTRGIIGAQSLIDARVQNPVVVLENGVMGWHLDGFELAQGATTRAPSPGDAALQKSREQAAHLAARIGVRSITLETLTRLQLESAVRSLYLFDVRSEEEYLRGHLPGARHAPGGELVQAVDDYVAVRNARIVLVDDCAVRATVTAALLMRMYWPEVYVLTAEPALLTESGPAPMPAVKRAETVTPYELDAVLASGEAVAVVDLASSRDYQSGHIPGAFWAIRSRLERDRIYLPPVGLLVLTSPDGELAHLTAPEAGRLLPQTIIRVLAGGTAAWVKTGLALERGKGYPLSRADDLWERPSDTDDAVLARCRMADDLDWKVGLTRQVARDGVVRFRMF